MYVFVEAVQDSEGVARLAGGHEPRLNINTVPLQYIESEFQRIDNTGVENSLEDSCSRAVHPLM